MYNDLKNQRSIMKIITPLFVYLFIIIYNLYFNNVCIASEQNFDNENTICNNFACIVKINNKYGLYNKELKFEHLSPKYDNISEVPSDKMLFIVQENENIGLYNVVTVYSKSKYNKFLLPCKYSEITPVQPFNSLVFKVKNMKSDKYAYYDMYHNKLSKFKYDDIDLCEKSSYALCIKYKIHGEWIEKNTYTKYDSFKDGVRDKIGNFLGWILGFE